MSRKINYTLASPEDIESVLGRQLEKLRLGKNVNQTSLAAEAGVSRRTITRLENGEGVSLDTFIRVMRALGVVDRLDTLFPDPTARPVERIRLGGHERKRARMKPKSETAAWTWGTESDEQ
jgi:transcriptional regulator with XRE-family HTH domain